MSASAAWWPSTIPNIETNTNKGGKREERVKRPRCSQPRCFMLVPLCETGAEDRPYISPAQRSERLTITPRNASTHDLSSAGLEDIEGLDGHALVGHAISSGGVFKTVIPPVSRYQGFRLSAHRTQFRCQVSACSGLEWRGHQT
jgi:hypothetical protein